MIKRPEILSPAGDMEKLKYSIVYGADAVYMAGNMFGMRASAGNFDDQELKKGIAFAHDNNVQAYVAVNVMPRNDEIERLPDYLAKLQDFNADAIILADMGVLSLAKKYAPNVPVHISTQASIVNYQSARMWHDIGASRVVLARELTLDEISCIRDKTPKQLQIETFVHGAMCISYSGRCLISSFMTHRDANRGECAQPCRWKYNLVEETRPGQYFPVYEDDRGTYLYNSKDLCMIEHIQDLIKVGIDSFKIEGRAKTAYYTAGITNAYKQAVNAYFKNPGENFKVPQDIVDEIHKVSHRNYFTGFYFDKDENGQYYEDSHYIRSWDIVAIFERYDGEEVVFSVKNRFYKGDEVELMQPNKIPHRFTVDTILNVDNNEIDVARHPGMLVKFKFAFDVSEYAILRRQRKDDEIGGK